MSSARRLLTGTVLGAATVVLAATPAAAQPSNDNFPGVGGSLPGSTVLEGSTVDATGEPGEPDHAGGSLASGCSDSVTPGPGCNASVWYTWTAPATEVVQIDTCGSDYDTTLAIYTGDSVGALTEIGANDDSSACAPQTPGTASSVSLAATSGQSYRIAVAGFEAASGNFVLRVDPPADTTAPDTTVVGTTEAFEGDDVNFGFDSNEPGFSFECSLDGEAFFYCTSPLTYGDVPAGDHTFAVRAVDPSGNVDPSPAVQAFTVRSNQPPVVAPPPPPPQLKTGPCSNERNGTNAADTIVGTPAGDLIRGLAGNDKLDGAGGRDCLLGGAGNDTLAGGTDWDRLAGEAGTDRLSGGNGNDVLAGGAGNDKLSGGRDPDRLSGGAGKDTLTGGPGRNSYSGGAGNDSINSANGVKEKVNCGSGRRDRVRADKRDRLRGCEVKKRVGR